MKIIEKPKQFDPSKRFSTWIFTLANNLCKNEYRKQGNKQKVTQNIIAQSSIRTYQSDQIDQNKFQQDLNVALEKLPEAHRACFVLRYKEEMSVAEISKVLNCPEGTIKSRLFYATKKLSKLLKSWEKEQITNFKG